jgi:alkyldihydroxyacetonephosphate synthase
MAAPSRDMRWWGWGDPAHRGELPPHAVEVLHAEVGLEGGRRPPVALEDVRLREPRLPDGLRERLTAVAGADGVRDDRRARVLRAAGKSYPDLVRQRAGDCEAAPDAVVFPRTHDEVRAVLQACAQADVAVVPFGGGTSVVGGVEPWRGAFDALLSLDLGRLDALVGVDETSLTAVVEPGIRGPELEALLGARGYTLGHFPQSFEYASIGGYVATRSAGQASTGYGRIDELVLGVRCACPAGDLELAPIPASAAGPSLRQVVVGSEGTLGVITQAALRLHRAPAARRYEGFMISSFEAGVEALRALEQEGVAPDVARLSDRQETRITLLLAGFGTGGLRDEIAGRYLRARGAEEGCLMITGWEGTHERVADRRAATVALLRRHGAVGLGRSAGDAWVRNRYAGPYLRDDLMDRGVMVETLETAGQWSDLVRLYRAVGDALSAHAPIVMCHVSHLYGSGASLYYTFIARQEAGAEIEQWRRTKAAACEAIVSSGGTITHHHAIGRDHAPWMRREVGETGVAALGAVKALLDPAGIMNPGKLLPGD